MPAPSDIKTTEALCVFVHCSFSAFVSAWIIIRDTIDLPRANALYFPHERLELRYDLN